MDIIRESYVHVSLSERVRVSHHGFSLLHFSSIISWLAPPPLLDISLFRRRTGARRRGLRPPEDGVEESALLATVSSSFAVQNRLDLNQGCSFLLISSSLSFSSQQSSLKFKFLSKCLFGFSNHVVSLLKGGFFYIFANSSGL